MIAPLYKNLADYEEVEQTVLALTTARTTFQNEGIPFISFSHLASDRRDVQEVGKKLIGDQYQHPDIPREESIAYMGLSYLDLIHEHGPEAAEKLYAAEGRKAFLPKETFRKFLRELKPDLVVATNSPRAERAALEVASEFRIPSICLVDLFTEFELKGFLSNPGYGTKICVLNSLAKDILTSAGRPENEIIVTGNPAFDSLTSVDNVASGQHYRKLHKLEGQTSVLWARSTLPEDIELTDLTEKTLVNLALNNPKITVIIRPHPNEPPRIVPQAPNIIISGKEDSIAKVLHAVDIVCTLYSTVAVEASLLGKKVIQITGTELFKSFNCVRAGFAIGADTMDELETEILGITHEPMTTIATTPNLDATSKVVMVIKDVLNF